MVLIIEDDDDTRAFYQEYLELVGVEVVCAATGAEAREHARANAIDAVILDWSLPDVDGPTLYPQLQAIVAPRPLPALAVTGHELDEAARANFTAVMQKPVDVAAIVAWIRRVVPTRAGEPR